ncbi:MAG: YkvA family protein [Polyangiaceae bacterium]
MSTEIRCLESFPLWLRSLGDDARALSALLETSESTAVVLATACALTYLFKSVDLIPDGLEDLGYMDDAFVVRVACARTAPEEREQEGHAIVKRLADEAALVQEFLGDDYAALERYVERLSTSSARGRSVSEVVDSADARSGLSRDVREWAGTYGTPGFGRDAKNLVKLRAFLRTKLGVN